MAEERGIELVETKDASAEDFTELVTVRVSSGDEEVEVAGTSVGPRNEPYLVSAWGESFYLPFAEHISVFRYADQPGMIGRVGTIFGEEGVNIVSAAVGAEHEGESAVMALTTDAPVEPRRSRRSSASTASRSAAPSTSEVIRPAHSCVLGRSRAEHATLSASLLCLVG